MPRLIWSPSALHDVRRLHHFLAEKNSDAAKRAIGVIREGINILARHPGIGRPMEEMEPEYRERLIEFGGSGYVVLYRYDEQAAVILAIRHQKEAGY